MEYRFTLIFSKQPVSMPNVGIGSVYAEGDEWRVAIEINTINKQASLWALVQPFGSACARLITKVINKNFKTIDRFLHEVPDAPLPLPFMRLQQMRRSRDGDIYDKRPFPLGRYPSPHQEDGDFIGLEFQCDAQSRLTCFPKVVIGIRTAGHRWLRIITDHFDPIVTKEGELAASLIPLSTTFTEPEL